MEGESIEARLRREYTNTALAGWLFNIPITVINFTLVPLPFRVIVLDGAECVWSAVMSYLSHRQQPASSEGGEGSKEGGQQLQQLKEGAQAAEIER